MLLSKLIIKCTILGAPQKQHKKFQIETLEKEAISGQTSTKWDRRQDILTDWLTVSHKVTLTLTDTTSSLILENSNLFRDFAYNSSPFFHHILIVLQSQNSLFPVNV
jgi:hypothetical protein